MVKVNTLPTAQVVAGTAIGAVAPAVDIIFLMAGYAFATGSLSDHIGIVAGGAAQVEVASAKRIAGFASVIKLQRLPVVLTMTARTISSITPAVCVCHLMTAYAAGIFKHIQLTRVAARAGQRLVCTTQRKLGVSVLEATGFFPSAGLMTAAAVISQTPIMTIVFAVTRPAVIRSITV